MLRKASTQKKKILGSVGSLCCWFSIPEYKQSWHHRSYMDWWHIRAHTQYCDTADGTTKASATTRRLASGHQCQPTSLGMAGKDKASMKMLKAFSSGKYSFCKLEVDENTNCFDFIENRMYLQTLSGTGMQLLTVGIFPGVSLACAK